MASIQQRVQVDLERGDYGLARQRLASHLGTKGYDAEVVTQLGQISYDMKDLFQAGRYWLVAPVEGEAAEAAIATFLRHAGRTPEDIASQLSPYTRTADLSTYPELVRQRLRELQLHEAILREPRDHSRPPKTWRDRVAVMGCLLTALLLITIFVIGVILVVYTIWRWVFGD